MLIFPSPGDSASLGSSFFQAEPLNTSPRGRPQRSRIRINRVSLWPTLSDVDLGDFMKTVLKARHALKPSITVLV